jgi:hypothetical protein
MRMLFGKEKKRKERMEENNEGKEKDILHRIRNTEHSLAFVRRADRKEYKPIRLPSSPSPFIIRRGRYSPLTDALMDDVVAVPFLQSGILSDGNGFCYQLPDRMVNAKPSTYCFSLIYYKRHLHS